MKHIEINIWKACNNKCRFCMSAEVGNDEKQLTQFILVQKEIKYYANKWYTSIGFLWWDISIHKDIYKIVWEAKKQWFEVINIITNGMIFEDYSKAEKLVLSWVTRVNISIHSHNDSVEDHLTQIPWWLQRKLKAIDNFNDLHAKWLLLSPISINIVLNWLNYKNILETCVYFNTQKRIRDIRINFIWTRFFYSKEDENNLPISYSEVQDYIKKIIYYSLKYNTRITFDAIPPCIFYKMDNKNYKKIVSKFLGEEHDHIEEISNLNLNWKFNWKKQKTDELKMKFKSCERCSYKNTCQWVWKEYIEQYWDTEFIPISDNIYETRNN